MKNSELTVAVIAGGKSRRFGSSKLEAQFQQSRLIDIALKVAKQLSPNRILVRNDPGIQVPPDVMCVADIYQNSGPMAGVHAALTNCKTNWLAVLPVDMPLLEPFIYEVLLEQAAHDKPVVAESDKGTEPLVSVWPHSALETIDDCLKAGRLGIYKCLGRLQAKKVDCTSSGSGIGQAVFTNINFPADLDNLKKTSGLL